MLSATQLLVLATILQQTGGLPLKFKTSNDSPKYYGSYVLIPECPKDFYDSDSLKIETQNISGKPYVIIGDRHTDIRRDDICYFPADEVPTCDEINQKNLPTFKLEQCFRQQDSAKRYKYYLNEHHYNYLQKEAIAFALAGKKARAMQRGRYFR